MWRAIHPLCAPHLFGIKQRRACMFLGTQLQSADAHKHIYHRTLRLLKRKGRA